MRFLREVKNVLERKWDAKPKFYHGKGLQLLISASHSGPSYPSLQIHVKLSPLFTQVPPLWQGEESQAFTEAKREEIRNYALKNLATAKISLLIMPSWSSWLMLTKLTSAAFKLLWTVTGESVPKVTTGAPVLTSVSVTLRISWKQLSLS